MPTLMPVCLSSLCPRLPGRLRALGWGVQPPPAAHAAAHLPGGGTPTTSAASKRDAVAGQTLEKGGEVPSGLGPSPSHRTGNLERLQPPSVAVVRPWLSLQFPSPSG